VLFGIVEVDLRECRSEPLALLSNGAISFGFPRRASELVVDTKRRRYDGGTQLIPKPG
jgi:hypothetical protein